MSLQNVREGRRMPFLKRGMTVNVNGKYGKVTGEGDGLNIRVRFEYQKHSVNIHPKWQTTYYDKSGQIIKDYKDA